MTILKKTNLDFDEYSAIRLIFIFYEYEDSKDCIAFDFDDSADGINVEWELEEEDSKEVEDSADCVGFDLEEEDYTNCIDFYQVEITFNEAVQTCIGQLNGIPVGFGFIVFFSYGI